MTKFKISGVQTVTFSVDIEADTAEEALDLFQPYDDNGEWYGVEVTTDFDIAK